jgi:hypothetical protein
MPSFWYGNGQGTLRVLGGIVLYRLAFLVFYYGRLGSVSHLVVRGVVDEMWDFERAIVPLVEVVLFWLVDQGLFASVRHG